MYKWDGNKFSMWPLVWKPELFLLEKKKKKKKQVNLLDA